MPFLAFIPAGAFQTIRSAYQSSSSASSLAAGAPGLLAQARQSRGSAAGLEGSLAQDTAKLLALRGELASAPDLSPVSNQVKMQSGFFTSPRAGSRFPGGPVELRGRNSRPAASARARQHRLGCCCGGELLSTPCPGLTDPKALPSTLSQPCAFPSLSLLVSPRPT